MASTYHYLNLPGTYTLRVTPGVLDRVIFSNPNANQSSVTLYDGPVSLNKIIGKVNIDSNKTNTVYFDMVFLTSLIAVMSSGNTPDVTVSSF